MPTQVIILGFHRSGTSVFTDYLNQCGLHIGDDLLGATPTNHRGHFEDRGFVNFQQSMLRRADVHWLAVAPYQPVYTATDHKEAIRLLANRDCVRDIWGFKDPRTCLFWDLWDTHASNPVYVVPLRHYQFCVDSIQRRALRDASKNTAGRNKNMEIALNPDLSARSWLLHMSRVLQCIDKAPERSMVINMHHLNEDSRPVDAIEKRFELGLKSMPFSIVFDRKHFKSSMPTPPKLSEDIQKQCDELWDELVKRSERDGLSVQQERVIVLKTDNPAYERLRLQRSFANMAGSEKGKAPDNLTDVEVADLFGKRMRTGRYGRISKAFYPLLEKMFNVVRKL